MASLWKHPKSPYWTCCYTSADGKRMKKSTKQTNKSKAMEACLGFERAEAEARKGVLTEVTARRILGDIVERTTGEKLHVATAREWLAGWAKGKVQAKARKTGERYSQVIDSFLTFLGKRAEVTLAAVSTKDILNYREARLASGVSARTCNLDLKIIGSALGSAYRQSLIPANPVAPIDSLPVETEEKGTFTAAQVAEIVAAAEGEWKGAILLGYYSGARLSDVTSMRWENVDTEAHLIRFTPRKTKKEIVIPLHRELERVLLDKPGIGKAFLFPTLAGKPTGGKTGLSGQFKAILERTATFSPSNGKPTHEAGRNRQGKGRSVARYSFHSLRHSFNSALANAGVSQELRQKLTGHASAEVNALYTHHELAPLREAVEKLPAVGL